MSEKEEILRLCAAFKKHKDILASMLTDLVYSKNTSSTFIIGFAIGRMISRGEEVNRYSVNIARLAVKELLDECVQKL